jgi:hypothetical protein
MKTIKKKKKKKNYNENHKTILKNITGKHYRTSASLSPLERTLTGKEKKNYLGLRPSLHRKVKYKRSVKDI